LREPEQAYLSRYALGRDYHKLMRKRLQKLADFIRARIPASQSRAFVDSAPVLEKALAEKAGLGWIGKHTLLINRQAGSWFFLGELYTNLPLPIDTPTSAHCGSCRACIDICPTQAIIAPYQLDAPRCISYLTIELKTSIPVALRRPIGNRVFGCDDCQLVCPWNRFAKVTGEADFHPRHGLDRIGLLSLFSWSEASYLQRTEGSALRRVGYQRWLRNLAIGLGNAPGDPAIVQALSARMTECSELVQEHIHWALDEQRRKLTAP
jgi:epoxyqueuosine reductase